MSVETAQKAVRFAFENSTKWADISFFGGEPLLEKALLLSTVDYSNEFRLTNNFDLPVRYFVTTNGVLIDEAFLQACRDRKIVISLSLDGHQKGHNLTRSFPDGSGSFEAISDKFELIQKYFPSIQILVTFTPKNVSFLAEGIEKLFYCGFKYFFVGPNYEENWEPQTLDLMKQEYEKLSKFYYKCFLKEEFVYISIFDGKIASHTRPTGEICSCCDKNDGEIAVAPSGNLYPCLRFVKGDEDHSLLIGTLDQGIEKKKRAKIMLESAREWPECVACGLRGRCFHYCCALNYKVTQKFNQPPQVLCIQEQCAISFADDVATRLFKEKNPLFLQRFYEKS